MSSANDAPVRDYKSAKRALLAEFDRDYLERLMERSGGNISAAARTAKLSRRHLREMLKNYGMWTPSQPFGGFDE